MLRPLLKSYDDELKDIVVIVSELFSAKRIYKSLVIFGAEEMSIKMIGGTFENITFWFKEDAMFWQLVEEENVAL